MTEKKIRYPAEITFKAVFRNFITDAGVIDSLLNDYGIDGSITSKESNGGKFISYTITAVFESDESLNAVCSKICGLDGYMTMF